MHTINAFYSDPHFNHKNIIRLTGRPFDDLHHMNEELIRRYNEVIGPDDTVLWLGDCFFGPWHKFELIAQRLNGHRLLIMGNHDRNPGRMAEAGFALVMEECFLQIAGRVCRVTHYPYINAEPPACRKDDRYAERRPPRVKGEVLIHGHNHANYKGFENMIHVGVDGWDFRPALMHEVEDLIRKIT